MLSYDLLIDEPIQFVICFDLNHLSPIFMNV